MTGIQTTGMPTESHHGFNSLPSTKLGWWAVGLMITFVVLFVINGAVFMQLSFADTWWQQNVLPFYGIGMLVCGLAAGVTSLVAIIRNHERSWLLWLPVLVGLFVVFLLVGELAFPH